MPEKNAAIVKLVDNLATAEFRGDVSFLERNLADDFVGIGPRGYVLTKTEWVGRHRSGDLKYASLETHDVIVHVSGSHTAIATAREVSSVIYQGKSMPKNELRIMEVFVRDREGDDSYWRLAAKQLSPILPPPNIAQQQKQAVAAKH